MYVDLHVHLRGTISRATAQKLARRNGIGALDDLLAAPDYGWTNFKSFLHAYDRVASVVTTAADIEEVAYDYLRTAAADGTGYLEFMLSTPHENRSGPAYADQIAAIDAAADRALEETGIECRIIATAVRHLGQTAALEAARIAIATRSSRLVGFGLTGDEKPYELALFQEAFAIARAEGLKTTAHAGEHLGADTIIEAIEVLGLDRVGHGVSAASSPNVMRQLAAMGTPLEVCISSNLQLGVFADLASHPVGLLAGAGCVITLGTDDPAFFGTSLSHEYALARKSSPDLLTPSRISMSAVEAAFCDEKTKSGLRARLGMMR
ncbi:adenosine deaminase [Novosphingobium sp. SG720]|uniref:adenosine deaminase n=1 Tax=Novosphingobium sp. SG720 TaxID=2586998 RepID=UPI001447D3FA|nr:adenosine deaminase [Novosphingobium sp. SG720]NKJ43343.1 adenosine deaminase [Novosphingobium sp. SG720]